MGDLTATEIAALATEVTADRRVYDTVTEARREDGGASLQIFVDNAADDPTEIRIVSWDPTLEHRTLRGWLGKRLRVTVEVMED